MDEFLRGNPAGVAAGSPVSLVTSSNRLIPPQPSSSARAANCYRCAICASSIARCSSDALSAYRRGRHGYARPGMALPSGGWPTGVRPHSTAAPFRRLSAELMRQPVARRGQCLARPAAWLHAA